MWSWILIQMFLTHFLMISTSEFDESSCFCLSLTSDSNKMCCFCLILTSDFDETRTNKSKQMERYKKSESWQTSEIILKTLKQLSNLKTSQKTHEGMCINMYTYRKTHKLLISIMLSIRPQACVTRVYIYLYIYSFIIDPKRVDGWPWGGLGIKSCTTLTNALSCRPAESRGGESWGSKVAQSYQHRVVWVISAWLIQSEELSSTTTSAPKNIRCLDYICKLLILGFRSWAKLARCYNLHLCAHTPWGSG